jgi:RNA polymerase sigma-70 factor, ECF subfamily
VLPQCPGGSGIRRGRARNIFCVELPRLRTLPVRSRKLLILSTIVPHWPALSGAVEAQDASDPPREAQAAAARVAQIAERHLAAVWRTARDLGVATRDLEDVVQEVMLVCVRRLNDIEPDRERAFLLATTSRTVANWRRGRRRRPAEPVEDVDLGNPGLATCVVPRGPAEALEHKQELALVRAALDEMSEPQRVAFTLFELEELTAREIAEQLGLTEAVVFARVQRARAVFQRCVARANSRERGPR